MQMGNDIMPYPGALPIYHLVARGQCMNVKVTHLFAPHPAEVCTLCMRHITG